MFNYTSVSNYETVNCVINNEKRVLGIKRTFQFCPQLLLKMPFALKKKIKRPTLHTRTNIPHSLDVGDYLGKINPTNNGIHLQCKMYSWFEKPSVSAIKVTNNPQTHNRYESLF
jgi:hypothetical protein